MGNITPTNAVQTETVAALVVDLESAKIQWLQDHFTPGSQEEKYDIKDLKNHPKVISIIIDNVLERGLTSQETIDAILEEVFSLNAVARELFGNESMNVWSVSHIVTSLKKVAIAVLAYKLLEKTNPPKKQTTLPMMDISVRLMSAAEPK